MDESEYKRIEELISDYDINLTNELEFDEQIKDVEKFWRQVRMHLLGLGVGYLWMYRTFLEYTTTDDPELEVIHRKTYPTNSDYADIMEIVEDQEERVKGEWYS